MSIVRGWLDKLRRPRSGAASDKADGRFSLAFDYLGDLRSEEHARKFFSILQKRNGVFMPGAWEEYETLRVSRLDPDDLEGPIKEWQSGETLGFYKRPSGTQPVGGVRTCADYDPEGDRKFWRMPYISMGFDEAWFRRHGVSFEELVGLGRDLYSLCLPVHGEIDLHFYDHRRRAFEPSIFFSIAEVYWVNFFGRPYVEMLGAEKLRSAPCHRVEEMPDGGFMLMLTLTPRESVSKEGKAKAQVVKEHLGSEYFYHPSDGKTWSELKPRKVPDFDWSAAPNNPTQIVLIEVHIECTPDPAGFIREAPQLVAALKERMGESGDRLDYSKKSLEELDVWLLNKWKEPAPPEFWDSKDLWRELAAYLGEVVRRAANGEWKVEKVKGGVRAAVVRVGKGKRQVFDPLPLVQKVVLEGLEEAEESEVGIMETGLSPRLWTWLATHKPLQALRDVFRS